MAGIGALGGMGGAGGANPLGGMAGGLGSSAGSPGGGALSGMADLGLGEGTGGGGNASGGGGLGMAPIQPASHAQGAAFGDTLKSMVIEGPSASKAYAGNLSARFAAGDTSIDPHQLSIASAKAGVEIQMATRTISSAVSSVRTLFQMQV